MSVMWLVEGKAQTYELKLGSSAAEQRVNNEISFILGVSDLADAYFISLEASYDAGSLEFLGEEAVGLTAGGLSVSDEISNGLIGVSATRTSALAAPDSGDLIRLNFRIKGTASPGIQSLELSGIQFSDSNGDELETVPALSSEFTVLADIGDLSITGDSLITVTEGDSYILDASVFSSGVTDQSAQDSRVRVWAAVRSDNTDPESWDESDWFLLSYDRSSGDDYIYSGEIAFRRDVGTYSVALRADLDQSGNYLYGGINGFWDPVISPSAILEVLQRGPYRYVLAEWDFNNDDLLTSRATPENQGQAAELIGANLSGYSSGVTGSAANSNGWNDFAADTKYWIVKINTQNFESVQVSSAQSGSNTGPRDFQLQVSADSVNWSDVAGGSLTVRNDNFSSGVISDLELPVEANDQPQVYLRWLQTSGFRIDDTDGVSSTGTNRIDDIRITGINPNAARIEVWPGDTDNNSVVEAADVLPLGIWWLSQGPEPVYPGIQWESRETEAWIPVAATYADADGSGRVDQNDLKPVGLNFGDANTSGKAVSEPVAAIQIPRLEKGESAEVQLQLQELRELSGYAAEFSISGVRSGLWEVSTEIPDWMYAWKEKDRLLTFDSVNGDRISSAAVLKGAAAAIESRSIMTLKIEAVKAWEHKATLLLGKLSVVSRSEIEQDIRNVKLELSSLSSTGEDNELPDQTTLLPNFPNPFNPVTNIGYRIHTAGEVRIFIYNALGQKVATLVSETQVPGEYRVSFDASGLSSGIYLYELQADNQRYVRKMMLVK